MEFVLGNFYAFALKLPIGIQTSLSVAPSFFELT